MKTTRTKAGITHAQINEAIGRSAIAANYERTDEWGAAIPSPDDWPTIKALVSASDEFDDLIFGRRSTVDYLSDEGCNLAPDERRESYDRGGVPQNGTRTKAERRAPNTWSDCGHNNWRPGRVLDPFAGSGTTLQVATGHGREAIGIDIDSRNAELAVERIGGLFLEVEHHDERAVS